MTEWNNEEGTGLHLWDYVAVVRQRLPVAAGVFLLVVAATVLYAWTRTPRYTATSRLLIENKGVNLTSMQDAFDPGRSALTQRDLIQTQVQLIKSTPVMEAVLQQGFLAQSKDFRESKDPVRQLAELIQVTPARSGFVLDVSVERESPTEAARIVNAVVSSYLAENRRRRMGVSDEGIAELKKKAEELRVRLNESTTALHAFMATNRMVSFEDAQNIVVDRLKGLNQNLMKAEPLRMQAEAHYRTAEAAMKAGQAESIPGVQASTLINGLKTDLARLEQQYSEMRARLGDMHPQLQSTIAQMDAIRTKLAMESTYVVDALRGRYEQALNEEKMLREELRKQEEAVLQFNELAAKYNLFRQSRDSIQEAYSTIIRRIDELNVSQLSGQGDSVFVVSRAEVPQEKSWPSRSRMLLLGIFFGGLLAVGFCFFLDYMDTTVKGEADVRSLLNGFVIGGVPSAEAEAGEVAFDDLFAVNKPRSHFAEAFRSARTALAFSMVDKPLRSVVVTSAMPAEGKTLTAVNLAVAHAQAGKRTLLIDADLREPRVHAVFNGRSDVGLSNLLAADNLESERAIVQTGIANLFYMSSGPVPPNPVELLDSGRFGRRLEEWLKQYEMLVFDAPPMLNLADALVIGKHMDGAVLVVRTFVTNKYAAQQVARQIAASKIKLLGVLLNNVDMPSGAAYSSYYYSRYGGYYGDRPETAKKGWREKIGALAGRRSGRSHPKS
ncbi:MAG TPA: polysaccharide biosynthesis tyrosine autokinase [Kiritimatiellia bacterium]|nr:polysaccharide biosynthesis tyrosine autokinase [Kiritimatiellia bacterium]